MKKVFITGANRGLGLGFVKYYLAQGDFVVATCRTPSAANALQDLSKKYLTHLMIEILDVTNEAAFHELKTSLKKKTTAFDIVINNAAVCIEEPIEEWSAKTFVDSFRVNVVGTALIAKTISPFLTEGSKLIQMSSGRGSIQENQSGEDGLDAYGISKAALNMLTRRLATKFRLRKIIVISINPGWVQTEMGGASATLTVDEAIEKMTRTINKLSLNDCGKFIENDGSDIAW
ncbi:MAG: SDR family oxidoreductase [Bacteroidota bacterium]